MRNDQKQKSAPHKKIIWLIISCALLIITAVILIIILDKPKENRHSLPEKLTPMMTFEILHTFPHDPQAFTQGLVYNEGYLLESTGLYGESTLRKVNLGTGEVRDQVDLDPAYFGEGLALFEDNLFQLTWRENTGFVYDLEDFSLVNQFRYPTEGWGLTDDGERLIMSDGTSRLYFLDPSSLQITGTIEVTFQGEQIMHLNELEYIRGEIFANIWQTDNIIRIDPNTGDVVGWIDLSGILPQDLRTGETDVLNGIAYDPEKDRLFITGKRWPKLYEIQLIPLTDN
jgi:glutamine cyclotransferase